jgi:hypothetical protein
MEKCAAGLHYWFGGPLLSRAHVIANGGAQSGEHTVRSINRALTRSFAKSSFTNDRWYANSSSNAYTIATWRVAKRHARARSGIYRKSLALPSIFIVLSSLQAHALHYNAAAAAAIIDPAVRPRPLS